jgi:glycosyltransferase involved in cell wall biosynthesis
MQQRAGWFARIKLKGTIMKIAVCSTLSAVPWGGSEILWSKAADVLLRNGHQVYISFPWRPELPENLNSLRDRGAHLIPNSPHIEVSQKKRRSIFRRRKQTAAPKQQTPWEHCLRTEKPDLVLVSMSWHLDDLSPTQACRNLGIPYCLLIQAAGSNTFLDSKYWGHYRHSFAGATKCFFVSEQNRDVMEANLGMDLSQSEIVANPFCVDANSTIEWPKSNDPWRLACVGRIHFQSKAQDLLLQTLRLPKWRDRRLEVTLYGEDCGNEAQARALIELYGLKNQVKIGGFVSDITQVWRDHHGLVLPSRYEGNALAMIEAMLCGRVPIVTNVGRVAALVDDNVSGFVAPAATVDLLDDALERAWQRRNEWHQIGAAAAVTIRQRHSLRPPEDFAEAVLSTAAGGNSRVVPRAVYAMAKKYIRGKKSRAA